MVDFRGPSEFPWDVLGVRRKPSCNSGVARGRRVGKAVGSKGGKKPSKLREKSTSRRAHGHSDTCCR